MLTLLRSLIETLLHVKLGSSLSAPMSTANGTSTSKNGMKLNLSRNFLTGDAHFGDLSLDGVPECKTMERTSVMIPPGTYSIHMEFSPHFQFITPHLDVPGRTYIEIHPANYPSQLEGCIAVGTKIDGDALDLSRAAFDSLMEKIKDETNLTIEVS